MFYGVIQEEYIFEFNFKDTFNNLKKKVKNAILAFINKIEDLLNKGKDNKIKSALRSLLNKVKKLFGLVDKAKEKEELENITKELNEYYQELNNYNSDPEKVKADRAKFNKYGESKASEEQIALCSDIESGRITSKEVANRLKQLVEKYGTQFFNNYTIDRNEYPKPWDKNTLNKLCFLIRSGASSPNLFIFASQVADEVYKH